MPCFLIVVVGGDIEIILDLDLVVRAHGLDGIYEVRRHLCSKAHDQTVFVGDDATLNVSGQLFSPEDRGL